jgi:HK97 family phage major capsid protein
MKKQIEFKLFPQTFDPNNVMIKDYLDGEVPSETTELVLKDVIEGSKVMQLGKYEEMDGLSKTFSYFAEGPGAYWVGETQKIATSKAKWLTVKMEAKKLAVILPVSKEFLNFSMADFFEKIKPQIAEAFYKKFDEAAILGKNTPFAQSIVDAVVNSENVVSGAIDYDNLLAIEDTLYENGYEANAWISKRQNRTALRNAQLIENGVAQALYDRSANTIDGLPVVDFQSAALPTGALIAGDFDHLRYGIPKTIEYKIDESAQLSTIANEDGTPVNLFEQDMVALRATLYVGVLIIKEDAFAGLGVEALEQEAAIPGAGTHSTDPDAVANTHVVEDGGSGE